MDAFAPTVPIVGSGPAGLFAACELLRHGVKPRIVERRLAPHHEARGTALQPAMLETIDRAGLIEPFLHAGVPVRQVRVLGPGLREIAAVEFGSPARSMLSPPLASRPTSNLKRLTVGLILFEPHARKRISPRHIVRDEAVLVVCPY
jgi:2-polyprenyl-6-methoxyphenol hydroxylase-like FAD-dependent oxidoreductase